MNFSILRSRKVLLLACLLSCPAIFADDDDDDEISVESQHQDFCERLCVIDNTREHKPIGECDEPSMRNTCTLNATAVMFDGYDQLDLTFPTNVPPKMVFFGIVELQELRDSHDAHKLSVTARMHNLPSDQMPIATYDLQSLNVGSCTDDHDQDMARSTLISFTVDNSIRSGNFTNELTNSSLYGTNSLVGRALILSRRDVGSRIACGTIGITSAHYKNNRSAPRTIVQPQCFLTCIAALFWKSIYRI